MAYYAILNEDNIVTSVFKGIDEDDLDNLPSEFETWEEFYSDFHSLTVKRTSYNTARNEHKEGNTPFRGNYAGVGYYYDESNDVFYELQEFQSWSLNTDNWTIEPPIPFPNDGQQYLWNEEIGNWELQDD